MEIINEKVDKGITSKFNPIKRDVSLFDTDNNSIRREKFNEWAFEYPMRVVLEIESSCNMGCEYCSYGNRKNGSKIPKERIFELIDELEKMKVFELSLRGGEPTVHPDFEEIWDYAQSKKFLSTNIITNGLILDYEKAKKLLSSNSKAKIIISLDGFAEVNKHRNPKQYDFIMSWLPDILKEFPFQIAIISCLYRDTAERIIEFSEYLAGLELKFHDFSPLRRQGNAISYDKNKFLSFDEMMDVQKNLNKIKDKFPDFRPLITCDKIHENEYQGMQNFPVPLFNETYRNTTARITAKGDVLVSTRIISPNIENNNFRRPYGNIFDNSFERIWLSSLKERKKQVELFYKNSPVFLGWK